MYNVGLEEATEHQAQHLEREQSALSVARIFLVLQQKFKPASISTEVYTGHDKSAFLRNKDKPELLLSKLS